MVLGILQASMVLCALAFVGRVVLSLLPVGALGAHGARELPSTWAASHLLGLGVFGLHVMVVDAMSLGDGWRSGWALLAPWVLVAALRCAFLPGALVPRHEPRGERVPMLALALSGLALGLVATSRFVDQGLRTAVDTPGFDVDTGGSTMTERLAVCFQLGEFQFAASSVEAASAVALVVLVGSAFVTARRAPYARVLALLWLAWLVFLVRGLAAHGANALPMLAFGAGAAACVAWLRRGDRRALAVSSLAFGCAVLFEPESWASSLACLAVLVAASRHGSRKLALAWVAGAAVLMMLTAGERFGSMHFPIEEAPQAGMLVGFLVPAFALAASAFALRVLVLRRPDPRERIDAATREGLAIGAMLAAAALAALQRNDRAWNLIAEGMPHVPLALLPMLALVPLLVGLVGAPDERTLPPA